MAVERHSAMALEEAWRLAVSGARRSAARLLQHGVSEGELMLPGADESHGDADPADADAHKCADLEQLQRSKRKRLSSIRPGR